MTGSPDAAGSGRRRVLVVDDHPLVRAGIVALIGNEPDLEVCGEAGTFREALELTRRTEPDLAIVDLSLTDRSGLELVKRLTGSRPSLRVLVCSMHEESLFAQRALNAGAMGYINKQEATTSVVEAIRRVLSGKVWLSGPMTERMIQHLARGGPISGAPSIHDLTDRELEVFSLIGQGLRPAQIAEQLHLSVKTVEAHREKIKKRLNLTSGSELTQYAVQWTLEQG
jgi:DNA-binding NarL/FixJ family response regulator